MSMAVRKHESLLLFVALISATCFTCASAFRFFRSEGPRGRRLLVQSTETIEPRSKRTHYMTALQVRKNDSWTTGMDVHTDYSPLEPHPPNDYHDNPPPATLQFHTWDLNKGNIHIDYVPVESHPLDNYHVHPPPPPIKVWNDNSYTSFNRGGPLSFSQNMTIEPQAELTMQIGGRAL